MSRPHPPVEQPLELRWCRALALAIGAPGAGTVSVAAAVGGRSSAGRDGVTRIDAQVFDPTGPARLTQRGGGRYPDVLTWHPGPRPGLTVAALERVLGPAAPLPGPQPPGSTLRFVPPGTSCTVIASLDPAGVIWEIAWRRDALD